MLHKINNTFSRETERKIYVINRIRNLKKVLRFDDLIIGTKDKSNYQLEFNLKIYKFL